MIENYTVFNSVQDLIQRLPGYMFVKLKASGYFSEVHGEVCIRSLVYIIL